MKMEDACNEVKEGRNVRFAHVGALVEQEVEQESEGNQ